MKVEVLTVPACPNREVVLERLHEALAMAGLGAVITKRVIDNQVEAAAARMHGSPTVLIEGRDPFADPSVEPSVSCRLYATANGIAGAPSIDELVAVLQEAARR